MHFKRLTEIIKLVRQRYHQIAEYHFTFNFIFTITIKTLNNLKYITVGISLFVAPRVLSKYSSYIVCTLSKDICYFFNAYFAIIFKEAYWVRYEELRINVELFYCNSFLNRLPCSTFKTKLFIWLSIEMTLWLLLVSVGSLLRQSNSPTVLSPLPKGIKVYTERCSNYLDL